MSTQITLMRDMLELFLKEGRRRMVTLGGLFSALACIGLVVGMVLPKKWEASTLLIAEERNIIKPLMEGRAVPTTIGDQKAIVNQMVLSRRILREILAFCGMLPSRISAQDEERLLNQVKSRIRITSPKDELIRITYQDSDRLRTYKVANKLAEIYVREGAAAKERESREAFDFISKRVQEYGDKLTQAQQDLLAYYNGQERGAPRRASDTAPEPTQADALPRSGVSPAQLAALRAEEATLTAQLGRRLPAATAPAESRQTEEQYRSHVLQLEAEVNRLVTRYTDEYPEVKRAKRDLEIARQDLETAEKARSDRESARAAATALDDGVSRAARARLDEVQRQISVATGIRRRPSGRGVPAPAVDDGSEREMRNVGTDTTLSGLYRHYEATRDVYQDLLKRRENARVSMDLDVERRGLTLRIQEAAELPATPISMRFLHTSTVALLVAFLVPLALLFALVRLDPKVRSGWQIERFSRVAVLAAIPDAPGGRDKSHRRGHELLVMLMVGAVFLIYGVVFVIRQKMSS
jgi:polysaccharide chain length determinant protein (PEP-CTERM system associated)